MFILAVEEMNFTKAAHRSHVTQQCLSCHIKKLEDHYHTRLFERRPKLRLTTAGKSLYQGFDLPLYRLSAASPQGRRGGNTRTVSGASVFHYPLL